MVRSAKWMASMGLGLLMAWQASPVQAELSPKPGRTAAARSRVVEPAEIESDSAIEETVEMPDDAPADDALGSDDDSQADGSSKSLREFAVPRASNSPRPRGNVKADQFDKEVIRERYPDGTVRVEREVAQDDEGNYRNHGSWKTWDSKGNLVAQGEFDRGSRTGTWVRWYRNPSDVPLFSRMPYSKFNAPYISQATFSHDQLDGVWTIYDGKKVKISQFEFKNGKRHGTSVWFAAEQPQDARGPVSRRRTARPGDRMGSRRRVALKETYQGGRRLAPKVMSKYQDGGKKSEGMYLFAKEADQTPDDWWNCRTQTTAKQGNDERHGPWTTWYSNGQVSLEGNFDHDLQHGQFTWWHQNGQKVLEGNFDKRQAERHLDLVVSDRPEVDPWRICARQPDGPLDLVERRRQGEPDRPICQRPTAGS